MNFLTSLWKTYESAETDGWVDNTQKSRTILLPIYHDSMRSNGKNIISVQLDKTGQLMKATILADGDVIIFPVTFKSVARSSNTDPHPLVDEMKYLTPAINQLYNDKYNSQLANWIEFTDNPEIKQFLKTIQSYLSKENFEDEIFKSIYGKNYEREGLKVKIGKKSIDFAKCYIEFRIANFISSKTVSVTNYLELHQDYIRYVNAYHGKKITCNISGEESIPLSTSDHRYFISNLKLISGSDSTAKENYLGRFTNPNDVIRIGYDTSEKIHLMAKFLLENNDTHTWLGAGQHLINWFSDDLTNQSQLKLTEPQEIAGIFDEDWDISFDEDDLENRPKFIVGQTNRGINQSFIHGPKRFSDASTYYVAIIKQKPKGRVALEYFRHLQGSDLLKNLDKWQSQYSWEVRKTDGIDFQKTPNFNEIILAAYGVEREEGKGQERKIVLKLDNDSFKSDLYQQLVTALIDGQAIPSSIIKKLENNIKQRQRYPNHWYQVQYVSLAILHKQHGKEFTSMLDHEETDRSYLFGRLLAIYELIEEIYNKSKDPDKENQRITNTERYWSAYTTQPATLMTVLDSKVRYCIDYLKINEVGYWKKLDNELKEIIQLLSPIMMDKSVNQPLDYKFIFGYYAEKKYYYTKQGKESEE